MSDQAHFENLVKNGQPVGEVIAVDKFIIRVKGLSPVSLHSLVLFADGSKGFVKQVLHDNVLVLYLGNKTLELGTLAVVQHNELVCRVGKNFIGRVVSISGHPLDGKGPIIADSVWPVFNEAPSLYSRKLLEQQLESGVMAIDSIFPVVRGQRIAIIGDSKSGKTALATQMTINQKNTGQRTVFVKTDHNHQVFYLGYHAGHQKDPPDVLIFFIPLMVSFSLSSLIARFVRLYLSLAFRRLSSAAWCEADIARNRLAYWASLD